MSGELFHGVFTLAVPPPHVSVSHANESLCCAMTLDGFGAFGRYWMPAGAIA